MTNEKLIRFAIEEGFAAGEVVRTEEIVFNPSFRLYCEENLCGQYGANYTCPPDCGAPEQMRLRIMAHSRTLVLQTIWEIPDYTDTGAILHAKNAHNAATIRLVKRLREAGCGGVTVGASSCGLCEPCGKVNGQPCKVPELQFSCMSAYCIFVKKLADRCGMEYDCGAGRLAFFGLYAFD